MFVGNCYNVTEEPAGLSWLDAKTRCEAWNSHLAYIKSSDVTIFIHSFLRHAGVESYMVYIGELVMLIINEKRITKRSTKFLKNNILGSESFWEYSMYMYVEWQTLIGGCWKKCPCLSSPVFLISSVNVNWYIFNVYNHQSQSWCVVFDITNMYICVIKQRSILTLVSYQVCIAARPCLRWRLYTHCL